MRLLVVVRRPVLLWVTATFLGLAALAFVANLAMPPRVHPFFLLDAGRPLVVAHRGSPHSAPENTLPSLRFALSQGADIIAFEIRPTKDGEWVLLSDQDTERTTGVRGRVASMMLDEVKSLDAGATFTSDGGLTYPFRGHGITIPTLEEVFEAFPGVRCAIEVMEVRGDSLRSLARAVSKWERSEQIILWAPNDKLMAQIAAALPETARVSGVASTRRFAFLARWGLASLYRPKGDALLLALGAKKGPRVTAGLCNGAHLKNLPVLAGPVDDQTEMEGLVKQGVDGIITGYPDRLRSMLEHLNP